MKKCCMDRIQYYVNHHQISEKKLQDYSGLNSQLLAKSRIQADDVTME